MAASEVSLNIRDHGTALDDQKKRAKCNYCDKVVSGFSRLKCHLGGIRGDVAPCERVPTNVKEVMRSNLLEKRRGDLNKEVGEVYHPNLPWNRNRSRDMNGIKHNELKATQTAGSGSRKRVEMNSLSENSETESVSFAKRRIGSQTADHGTEDLSLRQAQKYIGRFLYETGIDFSAAKSPSFQRMINATLGHGQIMYKIPSCQDLRGWILQDEVKDMQQYSNEIRDSWASTGCSILLDGWTNGEGRELINVLVDCPRGAIYLRSSDISASAGNIDAMQSFFDEVLEEVGVKNVVQIITYSTSAYMEAVGKQLMDKYRTFFWTISASHCIEMMLDKIGMMDFINRTLEEAKIITKFIHSRATLVKLLRNHTYGCDLVKPCRIRSAAPFLTLENIVSEEERLTKMFLSSEWNTSVWASTSKGKIVADLVANPSFWTKAMMVLKATIPLVRVLGFINEGGKHQLGYIYETIDQVKEAIKEEFKNKKSQYMPFWKMIDEIWNNHLHSPLHCAGYFLNPSLFYSSDFFSDAEVISGLLCSIVRMTEARPIQDLITNQVDEYRAMKGAFSQGSASDRRSNISPAHWWSTYGGHCPELQRVAVRILSQTCNGGSNYGLKRSLAEKLLTPGGRNPIEQQRLSDLAFVHYNLQLQNFELGVSNNIFLDEIDPMDDWIVDEEAQEIVSKNVEPTTWMDLDREFISTGDGRGASNGEEGPSTNFLAKDETPAA